MATALVVGGGPAGCAAALTLRASGVDTTIVSFTKTREKPTETAVPRLRELLDFLGAADAMKATEPCYGIESSWGAAEPVLKPSGLAAWVQPWFIHRARFDTALSEVCRTAGITWIDAKARSIAITTQGISVTTTAGLIEAERLVIASGAVGWAARVTGQTPTVFDTLSCYWAKLDTAIESRLLHVESTATGWWYACHGDNDTAYACFVTDADCSRTLSPTDPARWNALLRGTRFPEQLGFDSPPSQIHGYPLFVGALASRHGPKWIAAGDAAVSLDPIGSSGTATAIESGILAARAVVDADDGNRQSLERFDRWTDGLIAEFLKQRSARYSQEATKFRTGFWLRRT